MEKNHLHCRSLRRSIKSGKPSMTKEGGVESTVHVDVEDHEIDGRPIRIFDCAGQVRGRPVPCFAVVLSRELDPISSSAIIW